MDAMLAEIESRYGDAIEIFHRQCPHLADLMDSDRFDLAFFHLRTELKQLEHQLAWILRQCFSRATTLGAKLTLLNVFRGAYQREVVQRALATEEQWMINNLKEEFRSIPQLIPLADSNYPHLPPIARQILFLHGLKQRIEEVMNSFAELCPKIIDSAQGWELREASRVAKEKIDRLVLLSLFHIST
jgi:hypothetical protein